jgi:hypothetical protein
MGEWRYSTTHSLTSALDGTDEKVWKTLDWALEDYTSRKYIKIKFSDLGAPKTCFSLKIWRLASL